MILSFFLLKYSLIGHLITSVLSVIYTLYNIFFGNSRFNGLYKCSAKNTSRKYLFSSFKTDLLSITTLSVNKLFSKSKYPLTCF